MVAATVLSPNHSGYDSIKSLLYKPHTETMQNFFRDNVEGLYNAGINMSETFVQGAKNLYDRYSSSEAVNKAKQMLYNTRVTLDRQTIYPIDMNNINNISPMMERWLLSSPDIIPLYEKQLCSGFDGTVEPFSIHKRDKVFNGILQDTEERGLEITYTFDDEEDMNFYSQLSILETWSLAKQLLDHGFDATSADLDEL